MVGQGQAQAAGQIGAANAFAQGLGGVSSAIGGGVQNYMLLNALQGGGGFGGYNPGAGQVGMITSGLDVA
jgi:hypothetical protein